jgi:hypothetical protein
MSSAAAQMSVSPELSLQMIEEAKGVNKLSELAALFSPPVSTENCQTAAEKRERLRCAYRKTQGQARSLEAVSQNTSAHFSQTKCCTSLENSFNIELIV